MAITPYLCLGWFLLVARHIETVTHLSGAITERFAYTVSDLFAPAPFCRDSVCSLGTGYETVFLFGGCTDMSAGHVTVGDHG